MTEDAGSAVPPDSPPASSSARPVRTLSERCTLIELLLLDVDGVLTDGRIIYDEDGVEIKAFHVRDGSGIKLWQHVGKQVAILSGRGSRVVDLRAAELDVTTVIQGARDKLPAYRDILAQTGARPDQVCFVGDDLPDVPVLRHCGLAVAVADACPEVQQEAHYVTRVAGGRGAVRETIELILRCQGSWQDLVERFRTEEL
jgi:3-deoxy-D-manno-octulosonate 8-phosphate phosphatase (KDO 8-P phosphatase)